MPGLLHAPEPVAEELEAEPVAEVSETEAVQSGDAVESAPTQADGDAAEPASDETSVTSPRTRKATLRRSRRAAPSPRLRKPRRSHERIPARTHRRRKRLTNQREPPPTRARQPGRRVRSDCRDRVGDRVRPSGACRQALPDTQRIDGAHPVDRTARARRPPRQRFLRPRRRQHRRLPPAGGCPHADLRRPQREAWPGL